MPYPNHTQGILRAAGKPVWLHLNEFVRNSEYRAYHRFARRLRLRHFMEPVEVRYAGWPIRLTDGPSFLSAWDEIFVNRSYDVGHCRGTPRLVDVGANIGLAALYWKQRYGTFRYIGFEPDPQVAALCRANLCSWGCDGDLHEYAVTGVDGEALFRPDGADGGRVVIDPRADQVHSVRTVRLSSFLLEETDLLKLDIEGAEVGVLEECAGRLDRVRNIFVEVHSLPERPQPHAAVFRILEAAGFRCYLQPGFGPQRPFGQRGPLQGGFDSLLHVFGVREHRR